MAKNNLTSEEKIWGGVSYLWILSLVALASRKDNEFVRFHANQGVFLFVVSIIMMIIPFIGWLINILIFIMVIVGLIKALKGEKWELPLVSEIAQKFGDWVVNTLKL